MCLSQKILHPNMSEVPDQGPWVLQKGIPHQMDTPEHHYNQG